MGGDAEERGRRCPHFFEGRVPLINERAASPVVVCPRKRTLSFTFNCLHEIYVIACSRAECEGVLAT